MALTVFANTILSPALIAGIGLTGRTKRKNARVQNQGGFASINVLWNTSLREYEIGFIPMRPTAWSRIEALFEVTDGGAYGFLVEDPKDCSAAGTEGKLQPFAAGANVGTLGSGFGVPVYRLGKVYAAAGSPRTYARRITRPKATIALTRAGVTVVAGAAPGNVALDVDTGTVTFVADAFQVLASIVTGATTVLNFANAVGIVAALSVGQRVYLTGITSTAAAVLNGISHVITAKAGSALTISTVTTGLAAVGGTAYKYPQAAEALAWSGGFYVPVHFASDDLDWSLVKSGSPDQRLTAGQSVLLEEIRE